MLATNVIILGAQVVVHLGKVGLLISVVGVAEGCLPVVGEVLVGRNLLDRRYQVLPAVAVQHRELLVSEFVVPLALDLGESGSADLSDAGTTAQLVERLSGLSVATQLHKSLGLRQQHFGIANLDTVDTVLLNLQIL